MRTPWKSRLPTITALLAATSLSWPYAAAAHHTVFSFGVDRFEAHGNVLRPPGLVHDFDGETLGGPWMRGFGTAVERDGFLFLTNPGTHFPSVDGTTLDLSVVVSHDIVLDGEGDFTASAYWEPKLPEPWHHYHFSIATYDPFEYDGFLEVFGLGLQNLNDGLAVEQHLTEVNQDNGIYRDFSYDVFPITAADVTGTIGMRLEFDDATNDVTASFSLDGGATWKYPFAPGRIFVGRDTGAFILSADPFGEPPAPCTADAECADDDPCTRDACEGGMCRRLPEPCFEGATCSLAATLASPHCRVDRLARVRRPAAKAARLVERARRMATAGKGRRAGRLLARADRTLRTAGRAVRRAANRDRLSEACARQAAGALARRRRAVAAATGARCAAASPAGVGR